VKSNPSSKRGAFNGHHHRTLPSTSRRDALVRNGHAPNGKQLYRCRSCGRQRRENPTPHAYLQDRREEILHAYQEREPPAWPHASVWRLAHDCLKLDQKKVVQLPPFWTILLIPDPEDPASTILELDERMARLCSKKPTIPGCGIALCRKSRQVVASAVGDRSRPDVSAVVGGHSRQLSPRALLNLLLGSRRAVIPKEQQTAMGPRDGRNRCER
jgi:hypothetical protein